MSEVEFRRPRRHGGRSDDQLPYAGLWWQIALGVFVGMLGHSLLVGLYVRWELHQLTQAWEQAAEEAQSELDELVRGMAEPSQANAATRRSAARARTETARPLAADERCVGGKRFRRVENGWVQVLEACR